MSESFTTFSPAAQKANEGIIFLTEGRVADKHVAKGVWDTDWLNAYLLPRLRIFKDTVLDYNPKKNIFLCKDDWEADFKAGSKSVAQLKVRVKFGQTACKSGTGHDLPASMTQEAWLDLQATTSANMLIYGEAGSGKSHIVKGPLREALQALHGNKCVWITASSSLAALGIDGNTMQSQAGHHLISLVSSERLLVGLRYLIEGVTYLGTVPSFWSWGWSRYHQVLAGCGPVITQHTLVDLDGLINRYRLVLGDYAAIHGSSYSRLHPGVPVSRRNTPKGVDFLTFFPSPIECIALLSKDFWTSSNDVDGQLLGSSIIMAKDLSEDCSFPIASWLWVHLTYAAYFQTHKL